MAESLYSTQFPEFAPPDPAQRTAGQYLLEMMRADPPGYWTANRYEQAQHFIGVVYIAVRAVMDVVSDATTQLQRRKPKKNKTTFGPDGKNGKPTFAKAMSEPHHHDEDWITVRDHPVAQLIERPNEIEDFTDISEYLALQNQLTGIAPLWTVPNKNHKPVELWALPTALTTPLYQRTSQYPHGAWRVQPYYLTGGIGEVPAPYTGTGAIIPGEEMARFMSKHPYFRWDGYAPLTACDAQLDILEAIDQARWAAMDQGISMDAVLTVDGLDDAAVDRFEAKLQAKHGGARKAHKMLVLSSPRANGQLQSKLQTFSQSPKDMEFQAGWEQLTGFVLAMFGVPQAVVGLKSMTSYSELYAQLRQFYHRQGNFVNRLDRFYTRYLCRPYEKKRGEYRVKTDLPKLDDPDLALRKAGVYKDVLSVNEQRAEAGKPPTRHGELPTELWLKVLETEAMPKQEPEPTQPGAGAPPGPGQPGATPVPAPLNPSPVPAPGSGTGQPGPGPAAGAMPGPSAPTGGAVPEPANKMAEGTGTPLQPGAVQKAVPGTLQKAQRKFSCVMVPLKGAAAERILALARSLPDAVLADDGREDSPHVTARFGLHTESHFDVLPLVGTHGPIAMRLGKVSVFEGSEASLPYDVLKIEVESPDLVSLHQKLGSLEHTDTHTEFNPHATIGYVRAGMGNLLAAAFPPLNLDFTADSVLFSNRKREDAHISLGFQKAMSAFCEGSGGSLVKPAAQPKGDAKKPGKGKRKRRAAIALVRNTLKSLPGGDDPDIRPVRTQVDPDTASTVLEVASQLQAVAEETGDIKDWRKWQQAEKLRKSTMLPLPHARVPDVTHAMCPWCAGNPQSLNLDRQLKRRCWLWGKQQAAKKVKKARKFYWPENYDKVKTLPNGKNLWAGANDWENGWTWAWAEEQAFGWADKLQAYKKALGPDHSPKGGENIEGTEYPGGEFIPKDGVGTTPGDDSSANPNQIPSPANPTAADPPPQSRPKLNRDQATAVKAIKDPETRQALNAVLLQTGKPPAPHVGTDQHLQHALGLVPPFQVPVLVQRGLKLEPHQSDALAKRMKAALAAKNHHAFPAYQLAHTKGGIDQEHNVHFHIAATHGLDTGHGVLLNRNSRFRIKNVARSEATMTDPGILHIEMEQVPPGMLGDGAKSRVLDRINESRDQVQAPAPRLGG